MAETIYTLQRKVDDNKPSTHKIELFCHQIIKNDDGSYLVYWGYHNHGARSITYSTKDCQLIVHKGGVITFPGELPHVFLPGYHLRCFMSAVTEDTVLTWKVKKNYVRFNVHEFLKNHHVSIMNEEI